MKRLILISCVLALTAVPRLQAQDISCSAFCVTHLYMDSITPNLMWAQIRFDDDSMAFINYPHVSQVTDVEGDTVGTGDLWFFGQFGNSTNDYPVTVVFDSIPEGFAGTFIFRFDTTFCALPFPCTTSATPLLDNPRHISLMPNPCRDEMIVRTDLASEDLTISLFDLQGRLVMQESNLTGNIFSVPVHQLQTGLYVVHLAERGMVPEIKKILVAR